MNLRQLEYFVILSDLKHMTNAAKILNTTQPNLSHAMSELERELGMPLFEKKGRNIILTKYGKLFLSYVKRSLNELSLGTQALSELVSPDYGTISFGFIFTMGYSFAPLLISEFKKLPENENISFSLQQGTTKSIVNQLISGEVDLALCSRKEEDSQIDFKPIIEQELVLITPLDHPLAKQDSVSVKQIAEYPFINFTSNSGLRPMVDKLFDYFKITANTVLEIDEDHTITSFVHHGFGIAILPNILTISLYNIKILKIKDLPFKRYIYLGTLKDKYLSPASQKFANFIINYMDNLNVRI